MKPSSAMWHLGENLFFVSVVFQREGSTRIRRAAAEARKVLDEAEAALPDLIAEEARGNAECDARDRAEAQRGAA